MEEDNFTMKQDFEAFFQANERRIHFQIHRLGIHGNWYKEFYTEGIFALWKAYREFDATQSNLGTFLNYRIRYRLIDLIRKKQREEEQAEILLQHGITDMTNGTRNRGTNTALVDMPKIPIPLADSQFWEQIREQLTDKQWKWVEYFIIADLSVREIMEIENVSADAVKGWGQSVRRKLRNDSVKQALEQIIND